MKKSEYFGVAKSINILVDNVHVYTNLAKPH